MTNGPRFESRKHRDERLTTADVLKTARRRAMRDEEIQIERARPALDLARQARNAAVVMLKDADPSYFLEGLKKAAGDELVATVSAQGTIQGIVERDGADKALGTLMQIGMHRRIRGGEGVLVFTDFDFSDTETRGDTYVHGGVQEIIKRGSLEDPAILLLGHGEKSDLITLPESDLIHINRHPIGNLVLARLALNNVNQLSPTGDIRDINNHE